MKVLAFLLLSILALSCRSQDPANNIVIIGVDTLDRAGIAQELAIINKMNPSVIAIDLTFLGRKDYEKDGRLMDELYNTKSLVMASVIHQFGTEERNYEWYAPGSDPVFLANASTGFVNTILEDDDVGTLKRFSKAERVHGNTEYHFAVQVAMKFDSAATMRFLKKTTRIVDVDYRVDRTFRKFTSYEVLSGKLQTEQIHGKIVLIGMLGPGNEDKFFTPLNDAEDRGEPDMYGVEYLAHIVAQVLEY